MAITARPRPIAASGAAASARARRPAPVAARAAPPVPARSGEVTSRELLLLIGQGTLVGVAILAVLGGIYFFFGETMRPRLEPMPIAGAGNGAPAGGTKGTAAGSAPTVYYRDHGDGTVTMMEIDEQGTHIRGTMNRADVPSLQEKRSSRRWDDNFSSTSRVNALGSAFR